MVGMAIVVSSALLGLAFFVTSLVAWAVRREDKASSIAAEPRNLATRVVRGLLGLHVNGLSSPPPWARQAAQQSPLTYRRLRPWRNPGDQSGATGGTGASPGTGAPSAPRRRLRDLARRSRLRVLVAGLALAAFQAILPATGGRAATLSPGTGSGQEAAWTVSHRSGPPPGDVPAGDEIITGTGDTLGWHLYAASSADGWRWHGLATLRPGGSAHESWIGQQCLTGDGRFVVTVVAPRHAHNSGTGMDRGGLAYAVDAHTGSVRPLAAGVSLAYLNPGCGTGDRVA